MEGLKLRSTSTCFEAQGLGGFPRPCLELALAQGLLLTHPGPRLAYSQKVKIYIRMPVVHEHLCAPDPATMRLSVCPKPRNHTVAAPSLLEEAPQQIGCLPLHVLHMNSLVLANSYFYQSINQSINQPINQSTDQSINPSISQSINQPINQSINQPINQTKSKQIKSNNIKSINQSISQ